MELCSWRQERQTAEPVRETRPTRDTTHVVACGRADVHGRVHRVLRSRQVTTHIVSGCGAFALYPWIVYPIELLHSLYRTHTLQTSRRPQCRGASSHFLQLGVSARQAHRAPPKLQQRITEHGCGGGCARPTPPRASSPRSALNSASPDERLRAIAARAATTHSSGAVVA